MQAVGHVGERDTVYVVNVLDLSKGPIVVEVPPKCLGEVAGADYQLTSVCKPHDCFDNNMVLLWAAGPRTLYGKVVQGNHSTLLGAPPPAVAAELDRLWRGEYRR